MDKNGAHYSYFIFNDSKFCDFISNFALQLISNPRDIENKT